MRNEVEVSLALEKEIQPDGSAVITIDAYNGCQLQCPYCFQMNDREWSRNIRIRTNIAQVLTEELKTLKDPDTELYIGSLSDPCMDLEAQYGLTRKPTAKSSLRVTRHITATWCGSTGMTRGSHSCQSCGARRRLSEKLVGAAPCNL